jgi:hypothetical protein
MRDAGSGPAFGAREHCAIAGTGWPSKWRSGPRRARSSITGRIGRRQVSSFDQVVHASEPSWRRRRPRLAAATLGVLVAVAVPAGAYGAAQTPGPPITNVAVSHITKNGATVTAVINPEGSKTEYRLELTSQEKCTKKRCEGGKAGHLTKTGTLPAVNEDRRVSIHLSKLKADTHYSASFAAVNSEGETEMENAKVFTTK